MLWVALASGLHKGLCCNYRAETLVYWLKNQTPSEHGALEEEEGEVSQEEARRETLFFLSVLRLSGAQHYTITRRVYTYFIIYFVHFDSWLTALWLQYRVYFYLKHHPGMSTIHDSNPSMKLAGVFYWLFFFWFFCNCQNVFCEELNLSTILLNEPLQIQGVNLKSNNVTFVHLIY